MPAARPSVSITWLADRIASGARETLEVRSIGVPTPSRPTGQRVVWYARNPARSTSDGGSARSPRLTEAGSRRVSAA